ncbi:MAG: Smr/MutS family protein, partial [Pseudomonadota bacterium]
MSGRRTKNHGLTPDDRALWRTVTDDVEPLEPESPGRLVSGANRAGAAEPAHLMAPDRPTSAHATPAHPASAQKSGPGSAGVGSGGKKSAPNQMPSYQPGLNGQSGAPKPAPSRGSAPIDTRTRRRLARGRIPIDGRIDLHGMRQDEAQRALRSFILRQQADGARTLLVITGKGGGMFGPSGSDGAWWEEREIGVLKRTVPQWLRQGDLRSVVAGFDWAADPHGGSGALYV